MDLSFFRRAQMQFASRSPARLDYGVLIASLDAMQSGSAAARASRGAGERSYEPMVELLLGGAGWRIAVETLGGAFSRQHASYAGKGA